VQIFGQGESPMTITVLPRDVIADRSAPRWRERLASVGQAQACVDIAVVDGEGKPVADGAVGEVAVRGPTVMRGYWRNPEASRAALKDGWLRTGDMGFLDGDGFLTLTDRSKDVIISGGSNIYPREVEEVLLHHADVSEVAVVGKPDAEWGEVVVAFVVPAGDGFDPDALDAWCRARIGGFKRPRHYIVVDALPKSGIGKVLKIELRKMLAAGDAGATAA
jgi:long-chain acyl-CoA synthetase